MNSTLIANSSSPVVIYREYLDFARFSDKSYEQEWRNFLARKYAREKIDLVILSYLPAANFGLKYGEALFPHTPMIVCPVDQRWLASIKLRPNMTGFTDHYDVRGSLEAALRLQPDTRHVVVVTGTSPYEKVWEKQTRAEFQSLEGKVDFSYLSNLPMKDIQRELAHLPKHTVVFYNSIFQDAAGQVFLPQDALQLLYQSSSAPIYSAIYPSYFGNGIVGGHLKRIEEEGNLAAHLALRILRGEKPADIPVTHLDTNVYMFDARELKRWGISEDRLPYGSVVLYKTPSFWSFYKWYVVAFATLFLLEAAFILALVLQHVHLKRAQSAVLEQLRFERLVTALSTRFVEHLPSDLDREIEHSLKEVLDFFQRDRCALLEVQHENEVVRVTHTCSAPGVPAAEKDVNFAPLFPWFFATLVTRGQHINVAKLADLPPAADQDRRAFITRGLKSLLTIPLFLDDKVSHLITLQTMQEERALPEQYVPRLRLLGEIFVGALERRKKQLALEEQLRFESLISDLSARFVDLPLSEVDREILRAVEKVAELFHGQCCGLLEVQQERALLRLTHDWHADGIVAAAQDLNLTPLIPWTYERAVRGKVVSFRDLSELPAEAEQDRQTFASFGIRCHLMVPLYVGGSVCHIITIRKMEESRDWQEELVPRLRLLGEIFVSALHRRNADQALRESEIANGAILESLKYPLGVLDRAGKITLVNSAWVEFRKKHRTGDRVKTSIGDNYLEACKQTAAAGYPEAERAYSGIKSVLGGSLDAFEMEYTTHPSGEKHWIRLVVTPLQGAESGAIVIHRDVSADKRAEMAIRESEERFRHLTDAAPVLVWMAGPDKLCTYFNRTWLEFTGRSMEQELGNGWVEGVHRSDLERCFATYVQAFDARREFHMDYRLRRFDGQYRWIFDAGVPRYDSDGQFLGYIGSCIDITDRREMEDALRTLGGRLITAQEEERARIARELHDDVSQRMALVLIGLEQLHRKLPGLSGSVKNQLEDIAQIANEVSTDLHHLSHQLHPSKLDNLGLVAAIRGYCRDISEQGSLQIQFTHPEVSLPVSADVRLCLYRIAQEGLRNVAKHSGALEATIKLSCDNASIELCISDSGVGFDPEAIECKTGIGLVSMRERLRLIGGNLALESRPGAGTRICARAPLTAANTQPAQPEKVRSVSA